MSDGIFVSDEMVYCAIFGSMITRQVMDRMRDGHGAPTDEDMDRFAEEANSVASMAIESAERCRRAAEVCEWCDELVANGKTHGEGRCFRFDDDPAAGTSAGNKSRDGEATPGAGTAEGQ